MRRNLDYFLRRYREDLVKRRKVERQIEAEIDALARQLEGNQVYETATV